MTVTRTTYRSSIDSLRHAQKSGAGEPAYLRWVNRPLGAKAAAAAHVIGLTPNAVTTISGALSLGGLAVLALAGTTPVGAVTASAMLLAGFVLDSADGQLARLAGAGSIAGEWLDHVVDAVRLPAAHLALAVALWLAGVPPLVVGMALVFSVVASVWFFAATLGGKLEVAARAAAHPGGAGSSSADSGMRTTPTWISFAKLPYDTAALFFLILVLPWTPVFLVAYTVLFVLTLGAALAALTRKYRSLQRAGTP